MDAYQERRNSQGRAGCLGAAGILLTRAFPSSDFNDIAFDMLLASALFFLGGLLLRLFWGARMRADAGKQCERMLLEQRDVYAISEGKC